MDNLLTDLRFALRMMARLPGFYAVTILTLALGIGANTAVFSFVKAALLDALPYRDAGQLVAVWQDYRRNGGPEREWFSYPNFVDYRRQNHTLKDLMVFDDATFVVRGNGEPEALPGILASPWAFDLLGAHFLLGGGFPPQETAPVAVLGYQLWQRRFGGDPQVIGKTLIIDDAPRTVVGVLADDFYFPLVPTAEAFIPLDHRKLADATRTDLILRTIGRLKPGVTLAQARADLARVAARIEQEDPTMDRNVRAAVFPLRDELMGKAAPSLLALLVAVNFVLLISCVNVANLLLARAVARRGEIGIRTALGAERSRLFGQLLTESLLLALAGGGVGIVLAVGGVRFLTRLALAVNFPLPHVQAVGIDAGVLAFTFLAALFTGILFSLAPARVIRRADVNQALGEGGGAAALRSTSAHTGRLLVGVEMALALVLLVGSALTLRSFARLRQVDTGYRAAGVLTFRLNLPVTHYPEEHRVRTFYADLLPKLQALPGTVSAGAVSTLPMSGANADMKFRVEGRSGAREAVKMWYRIATPGYFKTAGLPILAGRGLAEQDQESAPLVAVINQSAARQYFPGEDPVGRVLRARLRGRESRFTIVGLVKNGRTFKLTADERPAVYFTHAQLPARAMGIAVRGAGDPWRLAGPVRTLMRSVDATLATSNLSTVEDAVAASLAPEKSLSALATVFGLMAVGLAAVGLYGLMTYLTRQRTREIGIRMAMGADTWRVLALILRQALMLSWVGLALGVIAAVALTRLLRGLLFEISALDPLSFAASAALLTATALLAAYLPARRASRLDPAAVLRG
jgi:putative ABC transport system permease protein